MPAARLYYGWTVMLVAAAAMVGTLPGRTQGLGLITEPLLADLHIDRLGYAELNLWATLLGSAVDAIVDWAHKWTEIEAAEKPAKSERARRAASGR